MLLSVGGACPHSSSYLGCSACAVRGTRSGSTRRAFLGSHQANHFSGYIQGFLRVVSIFRQNINSASGNSVGGAWSRLWYPRNFTGFLIICSIFSLSRFFYHVLWSRNHFHHFIGHPNSLYVGCLDCLCHLKDPSASRWDMLHYPTPSPGPVTIPAGHAWDTSHKLGILCPLEEPVRPCQRPRFQAGWRYTAFIFSLNSQHRHNYCWLNLGFLEFPLLAKLNERLMWMGVGPTFDMPKTKEYHTWLTLLCAGFEQTFLALANVSTEREVCLRLVTNEMTSAQCSSRVFETLFLIGSVSGHGHTLREHHKGVDVHGIPEVRAPVGCTGMTQ